MILNSNKVSAKYFFKNSSKNVPILEERELLLVKISKSIATEYTKNKIVNLNFICTTNSRRSQFAQVWSFFAANYFNLNICSFSGGTEITQFHRNTVKTLQKTGFRFNLKDFSHQNPTYSISFKTSDTVILGFSKQYFNPINATPFIAITTCKNTANNCPFIPTANHRFHLPFKDPKPYDKTNLQDEMYLKISAEIAAEIFFIFSNVKLLLS